MSIRPALKRLWWMIAATAALIVAVVYLGVIPTVKGQPVNFKGLEERLLSDRLLPATALNEAAATGGMSRGGSFSRPSSPAPSLPRSAPSYSAPSYRSAPGPVIVPYPTYAPAPVYGEPSSGGGDILFLVIVVGFIVLPIALNVLQSSGRQADRIAAAGSEDELYNDVVTVSRLQVALLANARELQRDLTQITLKADLSTSAGLTQQLRETVLALLRHPDYWTHVRAESQTVVGRNKASELFDRLSLQERSKFAMETLINVGGQVQQRAMPPQASPDVGSHIVVTLLLGTADDRPLFQSVRSTSELRTVLQRLGSISPAYLLVYELLWTPQDEADSLSQDDLIANYPDLVTL